MAKQNFAKALGKNLKTNAGEELRKIEASKDGYEKFILHKELRPSEFNEYPVTDEKIKELKESLKHRGLLQNLVVIPMEEENHKYYRILVGETRYKAIGELLKEGDTRFEPGIRCLVIDKNTSLLDQKIIMEETNIKQRDYDSKMKREAIGRLTELYRQKNEKLGTNNSVTKKVAEETGLKERQIQRYNAVNQKLIPELQQFLDNSKISLERAAQFANMNEDAQRLVLDLLETNKNVSKKEVEAMQKAALEKEKLLVKQLKEKENLLSESEDKNKNLNNEKNNLEKQLELKEQELLENTGKEEEIRLAMEEELKNSNPNNELIQKLQQDLDKINFEKEEIQAIKDSMQKEFQEKVYEIQDLKKEIRKLKKHKEPVKAELTEEEKSKLSESYELKNIMNSIKKNLNQFLIKSEKYSKNYEEFDEEIRKNYNEVKTKIELVNKIIK